MPKGRTCKGPRAEAGFLKRKKKKSQDGSKARIELY